MSSFCRFFAKYMGLVTSRVQCCPPGACHPVGKERLTPQSLYHKHQVLGLAQRTPKSDSPGFEFPLLFIAGRSEDIS